MMSKLQAITPPIWIFAFTLFLIILTGSMVGGKSCDQAVADCETSAVESASGDAAAQGGPGAACGEESCSGGRTPLLPLSILALGFIVYFVWARQVGLDGDRLFTGEPSDASGGVRGSGPVTASASAPAAARAAPKSNATATAGAPKPQASSAAQTRAAPAKKPVSREKSTAAVPASPPKAAPAEVAAAPASAPAKARPAKAASPAPSPDAVAAGSASAGLAPAQQAAYIDLIMAEAPEGKEALAASLAQLIGGTGAKAWKEAPAGDLELLTRSLALAALLTPGDPSYSASTGAATDAVHAAFAEQTKKALHEHCVATIRRDLETLVKDAAFPKPLTAASVRRVVSALEAPDALAGLARCSKGALVELAAFLEAA